MFPVFLVLFPVWLDGSIFNPQNTGSPRFLEWAASTYQRTLGVRALKRTIEDRLDSQFGALPRDRGRLWLAVDGDGCLMEAA